MRCAALAATLGFPRSPLSSQGTPASETITMRNREPKGTLPAGLSRVEAGAQGEHKLQRGYLPSMTHSSHFISDPGFRRAVQTFLDKERAEIGAYAEALRLQASPYK